MNKLGTCCQCGKEMFCVDDENLPNNVSAGCYIWKDKLDNKYYVLGEYGSTIFDMEQGLINDQNFINKIKNQDNPILCDDCISLMLINESLIKTDPQNGYIHSYDGDDPDKDYFDIKTHYFNNPKRFRGEELFSLWYTCFEFLLPRLKEFRDWVGDYPYELGSNEKWKKVLGEMIWYVEQTMKNNKFPPKGEEERYEEAKKLFHNYFFHLWG